MISLLLLMNIGMKNFLIPVKKLEKAKFVSGLTRASARKSYILNFLDACKTSYFYENWANFHKNRDDKLG